MSGETMALPLASIKHLRLRIPGLIDLLLVADAEQIHWLNQHEDVARPLDPSASWLHRFIEGRLSSDLAFDGKPLPVFVSRSDAQRADRQKKLDDRLEDLRGMPGEERDEIAAYVSGEKDEGEIGVTVQQWCGRLFFAHYRAAKETYEAARLLAGWPISPPWRTVRDRSSGRLAQAKKMLLDAAEGDLHCVHGTSIGMENVARSVRKLRKAAQQSDKKLLSPDDILRHCLVAPPAVVRGCRTELHAPFLARPLTRQTVIVFLVGRAYATSGDLDVAFLGDDWSACPARRVIPEMLRAVWHAAHHDEADDKRLLTTINTYRRIWSRAVS